MRHVVVPLLAVLALAAGCGPDRPARAKPRAASARPTKPAAEKPAAKKPPAEKPPADKPRAEPAGPRSPGGEAARREEPAPREPPRPAPPPAAETPRPAWKVVGVHDGDTLRCLDADNVQHKVRLHGIDAPEIGQPFGTKSREHLAALAMGRTTTVDHRGMDRYGRTLARLEVDGRDVNREMVAAGMAWHYTRYDDDPLLAAAEREARDAARGLWADRSAVAPWDWRATEREREQAKPQRKSSRSK